MIIPFGKTKDTREKEKKEKLNDELYRLKNWHIKFAWLPTTVEDEKIVWLDYYWRRFPDARIDKFYNPKVVKGYTFRILEERSLNDPE